MKKFNFFAYMAAVVFGLMTVVSCSKDDDEPETFTWKFEIGTKDAKVEQDETFKNMVAYSVQGMENSLDKVETKSEAEAAWIKYTTGEERESAISALNRMARQYKDPTLYFKLSILRNGKEWKTETWTTTYDPTTDVQEHVYRFGVIVSTDYDEVRNDERFKTLETQLKAQVEDIQIPFFTEESAEAEWKKQITDHVADYQMMADQAGKVLNDDSFTLTVNLLCDDEVIKTMTWKTTYKK